MTRGKWLAVTLVALAVAAAWFIRPDRAIRTATGSAAHDLCSETFVSKLDPETVFAESLRPRPGFSVIAPAMRFSVDDAHQRTRASLFGLFESRAIFREGIGCVLVHGDEPIDQPPPLAWPAAPSPWPEAHEPKLDAVLEAAFVEPPSPPARHTKAVVIVHQGRIIAERYAAGYGPETPILGFSMTKSVTNALVGVLVKQQRLAVEAPAPIAAWAGIDDPRRAVTLEQLLRMTSGLDLDETGSGFDPSNQMFYDEPDMAAFAAQAKLIASPGTRWSYSSASTHLVSRIIRDRVGGTGEAVQRFARQALFEPLGMRTAILEMDATGTAIGAHYLLASARDWARFGSLFVNDGVVGGERLLPEGWVEFSTRPTLNSAYGAGWWSNRGDNPQVAQRAGVSGVGPGRRSDRGVGRSWFAPCFSDRRASPAWRSVRQAWRP